MRNPRVGTRVLLKESPREKGVIEDTEKMEDFESDKNPLPVITFCTVRWDDGSSEIIQHYKLYKL